MLLKREIGLDLSSIISSTIAFQMTPPKGANYNDVSPLMSTRRVSSIGDPMGTKSYSDVSTGVKPTKF
jgi:hypothetical protein